MEKAKKIHKPKDEVVLYGIRVKSRMIKQAKTYIKKRKIEIMMDLGEWIMVASNVTEYDRLKQISPKWMITILDNRPTFELA